MRRTVAAAVSVVALVVAVALAVPVAARAEAPCPNEQLRVETHSTNLPDCRAYELVTPPFKNGQAVLRVRVAPSGARVAFSSLGAFNEATSNEAELGATYIASRTSGGWSTSQIAPSAQQFRTRLAFRAGSSSENGITADFAEDLDASLFALAPLDSKSVDYRFYWQSPGDFPTEIGALSPPGRLAAFTQAQAEAENTPAPVYAGATASLSRVFYTQTHEFTTEAWTWPGDPTKFGASLYEYSGAGQSEPEIVGVAPGGDEAKKRPAEAPTVVSECGTILGGAVGDPDTPEDAMNAISRQPSAEEPMAEEGSHVVFTALGLTPDCKEAGVTSAPRVNEIFTRINGVRTVAVSEPASTDCAACDEASPAEAVFQGASADGTKIFFISEQRYFDGSEGEVEGKPSLYEFNLAATNVHDKLTCIGIELAPAGSSQLAGVVRVTNDGRRVYFVSTSVSLAGNLDARGEQSVPGADNLYTANTETGLTRFVGTLAPSDQELWQARDERPAETAAGDRYLIFASSAALTPDAVAGSSRQIYRYDTETEELERLSVGNPGFNPEANPNIFTGIVNPSYIGVDSGGPQPTSASADGERIFFYSTGAFTPKALNTVCAFEQNGVCKAPAVNIYEWESGKVYLISDGQDSSSVLRGSATGLVGTSESGDDVFFTSASKLVGEDTDTQQDLYDARVDGGVAPVRSTSGCQGEGCQGSPVAPPDFIAPSSSTLVGAGNLAPLEPSAKPKAKMKTAAQVRAQRLARALRACEKKALKRRAGCERQAKRRNRRSK